ncbi:NAD(P)/FAD-dependent oxidoreductase [Solirubrobacter ginsenosidimutans]|uniref:NADH:ubiquinone reductase (non-electrogenic) n=1 Tax=Solirubrobacter ginsenosidimutans TaxID=490573 RepID=A0A9X3N1Q5_9ACTN|nr:NAD(P)/FAD-dependent oxidoreductase [Solirubrobacter ginsenosidimutans]MDA0166839.1 NAD(P)/FAD-dependent oxidoreductase [Solirubrobacter ginsenosidimutans]
MQATKPSSRHRVAIVGAGFGGLFAAQALARADVDVTVIDRTNHHLFQPLLYQTATGILSEGAIAPPIREILRRQHNARVLLGEVQAINLDARRLTIDSVGVRSEVSYDSLILAAGAQQSYFGRPDFAWDAPGMKTIDDALELRGRIFGAFEMAEREPDPRLRRIWLTFVVVGAGPTGVELTGQIAELAHRSLRRNFRRIDPAESRIVLLDAAPTLLGAFPESLQRRAARDLERLGVELHLGARVTGVDAAGIDTDASAPGLRRLEAATKIWAAGVEASPLGRLVAGAAGSRTDRTGRVHVHPDCTLPGHPEVFVIGDLMQLDELPGVAQVAIQSGRHAAATIVRRLRGDDAERPFRYRDKGTLATISRSRAIASIGPLRAWGYPAWLLWMGVHLYALTGFKNRVTALFDWTVSFIGRGRPQRAITTQQVFARQVREAQAAAVSSSAAAFNAMASPQVRRAPRRSPGSSGG